MAIDMRTPAVDELPDALDALTSWQTEDAPFQLHPGDIGWFWRHGAEATAAALRTWSRDGAVVALGLLDGAGLLRLAMAPQEHADPGLAHRLVADITDPDRGVLPAGKADLEIPAGAIIHDELARVGWDLVEPWPVMRNDFTQLVEPDLRVEVIGERDAPVWAQVHGSAWGAQPGDVDVILSRWHQMASGPAFANARCLVGYDQDDNVVATVTVWSAGPGRHGVLEPMGVHADHRGKGHGRAMNIAAARALQEMGATSAMVCTPGSNAGGVAAYNAAGYATLYERFDRRRAA